MTLRFGPIDVTRQVFYQTTHSLALVNLRPIVRGHVLVIPRRTHNPPRFASLAPDEVSDLFRAAQDVSRMLERVYGASAMTLAIQDGSEAGQTIEHVHVHVIPRRSGDFEENDEVYGKIEANEKVLGGTGERMERSMEEMEEEARRLEEEMQRQI